MKPIAERSVTILLGRQPTAFEIPKSTAQLDTDLFRRNAGNQRHDNLPVAQSSGTNTGTIAFPANDPKLFSMLLPTKPDGEIKDKPHDNRCDKNNRPGACQIIPSPFPHINENRVRTRPYIPGAQSEVVLIGPLSKALARKTTRSPRRSLPHRVKTQPDPQTSGKTCRKTKHKSEASPNRERTA